MEFLDYEKERESFERLERLEELARENDDHYWNLGAGLDEEVNQYDRDSDYSVDDRKTQADETIGRHI